MYDTSMQTATVQELTKIIVAQAKAIGELSSTSPVALGMQVNSSRVHQHGQLIGCTNDALDAFNNHASAGTYLSGLQVVANSADKYTDKRPRHIIHGEKKKVPHAPCANCGATGSQVTRFRGNLCNACGLRKSRSK